MRTAIQKQHFSLTPQSLDEALRFADMLSKSSMVPKDYQGNPANCVIAMQWGMEIGLQPLQAMQNIAVINGRPAIWGDAMLAIVRGSGLLESIEEIPSHEGCTCTVVRKGEEPVTREFFVEDAKKAGLYGKQGPWQQNPKRMMQMRARAFALRDVFPDVLRGVHIAEVAQDEATEKDITAESTVVTPSRPAASRTEAIKQALGARKSSAQAQAQVQDPDHASLPAIEHDAPELAEVVAAISAADSLAALQLTADLAGRIINPDEKHIARQKYAERMHGLKAQAESQAVANAQAADDQDDPAPGITIPEDM